MGIDGVWYNPFIRARIRLVLGNDLPILSLIHAEREIHVLVGGITVPFDQVSATDKPDISGARSRDLDDAKPASSVTESIIPDRSSDKSHRHYEKNH